MPGDERTDSSPELADDPGNPDDCRNLGSPTRESAEPQAPALRSGIT